jgi:predicted outer membrane repeat protein
MKSQHIVGAVMLLAGLQTAISASVTVMVPQDYPTIQAGIDAAENGDTVLLSNGIYSGPGNINIAFGGKSLHVRSLNGSEYCRIDCEKDGRGFNFFVHESEMAILEGVTIANGHSDSGGGGIRCENASPTIRNCVITECESAGDGGGVYISGGSPRVEECLVILNTSATTGGGFFCRDTTATLDACLIQGNRAEHGAGVNCKSEAAVTLERCSVWNNIAEQNGGGLHVYKSSPLLIGCAVWENQAVNGAGFYGYTSHSILSTCEFRGNYAEENGGGLYCDENSVLKISNCLLRDNIAELGAAIVSVFDSSPTIRNSTLIQNHAGVSGGGIYCAFADITAIDAIFWGNLPEQVFGGSSAQIDITTSDIQGGYPGDGNLNEDPLFLIGPRGIAYLSQKAAGQAVNSPCINRGSTSAADIHISFFDGQSRTLDQLTTRSDELPDTGSVDLGYHHSREGGTYSVEVQMPSPYYIPDDTCWMKICLENTVEPIRSVPVVVILDVYGVYWFWDDWGESFDYVDFDVPLGKKPITIIPAFNWPDTGSATIEGIRFWGAMLTPDLTDILGGLNGVGVFSFGFGPR